MIVRLWQGTTREGEAETYLAHLREAVFPEIGSIPGSRGARVLRGVGRERDDFVVMTFWDDLASVKEFAGDDPEVAVVPPEAQALLAHYDAGVRHFEVALEVT